MATDLTTFLNSIGQEVEDAEEESFLLFSQDIPSSNLGFVDSRATTVDISIHNQDYTIHQSPTLLSSSRPGGTTGAVLWKITPLFAEWISARSSNPLWTDSLLETSSTVVELGCGISGLTALALAPLVGHYLATDQEYVQRLFRLNVESNISSRTPHSSSSSSKTKSKPKSKPSKKQIKTNNNNNNNNKDISHNITFTPLDWELDDPGLLKSSIPSQSQEKDDNEEDKEEEQEEDKGFDLLLSCDCIYNEALIPPFVRTCADISRLRPVLSSSSLGQSGKGAATRRPTISIIAQQQRSPEVFEAWLRETLRWFRVWRVSDEVLGRGGSGRLGTGTGYLVHVLVLR